MAMDGLDGYLQVPPDRGQILGRQSWKTRYTFVGTRQTAGRDRQGSHTLSLGTNTGRVNSVLPKPLAKAATGESCISVYKSKDEWEPIQQWPLACVSDCQVQLLAHRKQGPVLPTLVVTISDNQRKRRSSRATGFVSSNKELGVTTLWFRSPPEDPQPTLNEWARFIMSKKNSASASESPISPVFTSPFQTRSHDSPEHLPRPGSDNRALQHKSSTATYSTGPLDRPATFSSDSPSLRSKRSDISSPSSNIHAKMPFAIPEQHYTTVIPGDMAATGPNGEYRGQFIEGWTSAQGRSSTMSSRTRGRDGSMSSQSHQPFSAGLDAASPPAPGETILDRAFQLGHIPGAGSYVQGQEKLSSIARFDALMREAEGRRKQREGGPRVAQAAMRSAFDADDSSDQDPATEDGASDSGSDSDSDSYTHSQGDKHGGQEVRDAPLMSPSAQRALAYIAGRHGSEHQSKSHRPTMSRAHLSFHAGSMPASNLSPPSRPHTSHTKGRPNATRTQSTPQLIAAANTTLDLPSSGRSKDDGPSRPSVGGESKRHSNSSSKRLSFTEFTKRLSSTSSLLLVQTNASGGSSHGSSEADVQASSAPRTNLTLRSAGLQSRNNKERDDQDRRCKWRGSVGVVGTEGGFL